MPYLIRMRSSALLLLAAANLAVALPGCAINPVTGKREFSLVPASQEIEMGKEAAKEVDTSMGIYDNAALGRYVDSVGQTLAAKSERPELPWTFKVVDDPVVNAFALPGGPIYVTRGLLAHLSSEAQLVAVLGHEIGHVTAKHAVRQISKASVAQLGLAIGGAISETVASIGGGGLQLLLLSYGRDAEREADDLGFRYTTSTGYEVREMPGVFSTLKRVSEASGAQALPNWLSSHPSPDERVERINKEIAEKNPARGKLSRDEFLAVTDGLVYGPDPRHGFFENGIFKHPEMKFQLTLPPGWKSQNMAQAVVSQQSDGKAALQLKVTSSNETPAQAIQKFGTTEGVTNVVPVDLKLQAPGAAATFAAKSDDGDVNGLIVFLTHQGKNYRIMGIAAAASFDAVLPLMKSTVGSFGPLTDPSAMSAQPARLKVITATAAMTVGQLASQHPGVSADRLAIINQLTASSRIEAGQKVKIVEGKVRGDK